ncbi:MAG: efflux RND transporter periplasmic adaptor subunit [Nitrospinaceae bacterium]|jgi:HlyD family secretion protein/macrolide-specific efflux system membrane fusion protein|nr:MAG: efflux RND transporter periplasmic adaptor subunit [Nitrospinaceae bacterium]
MAKGLRRLFLLLILGGGIFWLHQEGWLAAGVEKFSSLVTGREEEGPSLEDYEFQRVTRGDVHQKVLATGTVTLKTGAEVKIGARISGKLESLRVRIGDFVRSGDLIAMIEHEDLLARVARFRADLAAEEARLDKIRQEKPLEINAAMAELEELQVQQSLALKMLERNLELNRQGVVSQTVVDESNERAEVLRSQIRVAEEKLKLEEARLENDLKVAQTQVERARATLNEEETQLSYARITAPIDGVVAFISTQEGETVVAGLSAPTFVTLIDLRKLEVTTFVDETDIGRISVGQSAVFSVDTYADKLFKAEVREIRPKAVIKDNVVNYEVILEIDPKHIALLRAEMTANVVVTTGTRKQVLLIPREALNREGKKTFVLRRQGETLEEVPVEIGWREGKVLEMISGVNEGDEIGILKKTGGGNHRKGRRSRRR